MWANVDCTALSSSVDADKLEALIRAIAKNLREVDQATPEWSCYGDSFYLNSGATIDDCPYWPAKADAFEGFSTEEIATILKVVEEYNGNGEYFFVTLSVLLRELGWLPDELPCGTIEWGYEDGPGGDPQPFPCFAAN